MNQVLSIVYIARHGETAWTISGQHTGLTDLPLTERGERNARRLEERLHGLNFAKVFTSPLQRAKRTCELAGFGAVANIDQQVNIWDLRLVRRGLTRLRLDWPDSASSSDDSPGSSTADATAPPAVEIRLEP